MSLVISELAVQLCRQANDRETTPRSFRRIVSVSFIEATFFLQNDIIEHNERETGDDRSEGGMKDGRQRANVKMKGNKRPCFEPESRGLCRRLCPVVPGPGVLFPRSSVPDRGVGAQILCSSGPVTCPSQLGRPRPRGNAGARPYWPESEGQPVASCSSQKNRTFAGLKPQPQPLCPPPHYSCPPPLSWAEIYAFPLSTAT